MARALVVLRLNIAKSLVRPLVANAIDAGLSRTVKRARLNDVEACQGAVGFVKGKIMRAMRKVAKNVSQIAEATSKKEI